MSNRRLFTILAAVIGVTAVVILILVLIPKATVVEFRITTDELTFDVMPPRGPDSSTSLLSGEVKVRSMEFRGVERMNVARPNGEMLSSTLSTPEEAKVQLRRMEGFAPDVRLGSAARVTVLPAGRDRVMVRIASDGGGDFGWQARAGAGGNLDLRLSGAAPAGDDFDRAFVADDWTAVSGNPPVLVAANRGITSLGLQLTPSGGAPVTKVRVVDLPSGAVASSHDLPFALPQREYLAVDGDRVIVMSSSESPPSGMLLLEPNLAVATPRFFTLVGTRVDSHLLGGQIRFPAGERAAIELESSFLLEVRHAEALTLKSLRVVGAHLELVLWGTPTSVRLGPTAGLMEQVLPNYFVWLYNHRLGTLAFSLLAWMVGTTIAALKLFGWVKS